MQLQLISFVLILHCMEYANCQQHASRHRQHKQNVGVSTGCQSGCQTCSVYNGCLTCKPKLFIHLERDGMRQIGVCLASCPNGFYGMRSPDRNDCIKCGSECDTCFNKNFCLRCRAGSYLHKGKCQESCPEGLVPSDTKRECVPECPANCDSCLNSDTCKKCLPGHYLLHGKCHHVCPEDYEMSELMECIPTVHCEVGEWGEWSACSKSGKTCGFKWGQQTRTREVLQNPSPNGNPCPSTSEERECFVKRRRCQGKRKEDRKGDKRNRNNRRPKANRERKKDHEREMGDREDSENKNKTEQRHQRGQKRNPATEEGAAAQ
ncbi:R-spondin-3 [Chanos chanos]|uniref:R-spondin-3 n=1 Tax=Chanos chanos TaxID=29144 RepID=A0A6J2W1X1_CHACN|nr:R-spondin-3 [Chanos chanos]